MKTIVMTNQYSGIPLEIVQSETPEGFVLRFLPEQSEAALLRTLPEADYLLAGGRLPITGVALASAQNLKMIQRSGVGLDSLDLDAIRAKGIPLYVNQGVNAESVAEHTLLLILGCLRRLTEIDRNTRAGIWKKQEQGIRTAELRGKTVGVVGMGHIARRLVELLQPFGVTLLYHNRSRMDEGFEEKHGLRYVPLEELLARSDVVTLHCALAPETRSLIREETIENMKTGAVLVNTARGGLVDAPALAEALKSGKLAFAGLDVHAEEPIGADYPLKDLPNVIFTPHVAGVTADSFRAMMHDAFRNIRCFDEGRIEEIEASRYC